MTQLIDTYGRVHRDLRVSLTDRCNLRCNYCLPEEFSDWLPNEKLLTTDELIRVIQVAVNCGITEVRLTGGEPLLRPDIVEIVSQISQLENAPQLSLTTNGIKLSSLAQQLKDAGLSRINVSLDTLRPERFNELTHRDRFDDVQKGLKAAKDSGLAPIKINSVLMPGINDDEAAELLQWALDEGFHLRFIEQMPLDAGGIWNRAQMVTADDIFNKLEKSFTLTPVGARGSAPAEDFLVNGGPAKVGIIASVTRPFCGDCDRLRLTSDGQIRSCLFARSETDLRSILRDKSISSDELNQKIAKLFGQTVADKLPGHGINNPDFIQPSRPMSAIGG
jgi:cyclic pyranopterin phosphate synthase